MTTTLDDVREAFALLDDWGERYRFIIDLGRELPLLDEAHKTQANKVLGCQSQVWVIGGPSSEDPRRLRFQADSDAHIVRGLVCLVLMLFDGLTPPEVLSLDPRPIFAELGLDQHLSQGRTNGLLSMVGKIKSIAASV